MPLTNRAIFSGVATAREVELEEKIAAPSSQEDSSAATNTPGPFLRHALPPPCVPGLHVGFPHGQHP